MYNTKHTQMFQQPSQTHMWLRLNIQMNNTTQKYQYSVFNTHVVSLQFTTTHKDEISELGFQLIIKCHFLENQMLNPLTTAIMCLCAKLSSGRVVLRDCKCAQDPMLLTTMLIMQCGVHLPAEYSSSSSSRIQQ